MPGAALGWMAGVDGSPLGDDLLEGKDHTGRLYVPRPRAEAHP